MENRIVETAEKTVVNGKHNENKKVKKVIITIISLLLVVGIAFCGYFYIQNEKRYDEYMSNAKLYVTKVENACEKLEVVSAIQSASLYRAMWGSGNGESIADSMGWNSEEAKEAKELMSEISRIGYKVRNEKGIYFHEDVEEIRKLSKMLDDDFNKCAGILSTSGNMYSIITSYSSNINSVESGIRKLKNLIY